MQDKEAVMRTRALALIALALGTTACRSTPELRPAPEAAAAPSGVGEGAVAVDEGVRMVVRTGAWRGFPDGLATEITPLLVEITNDSDRPLLVRYEGITLTSLEGRTYMAMPPFDIDTDVVETVMVNEYAYDGFAIAPHLSRYYPRLRVADPFWWDGGYYARTVPAFRRIALPTGDMVQMALPEGVLAPGSRITGFVYFEQLADDISRVTFSADLVDATVRTAFGRLEIPFVVH